MEWTAVEPISCKGKNGRLFLHYDNLHTMNHWVAGMTEDDLELYMAVHEEPCLSQCRIAGEDPFSDFYEARKLRILRTVADGDCAFDRVCMILGWSRTFAMRQKLRSELAEFVYRHQSNRALYGCLAMSRN